ncbi:beta-1,3-galactosyltransferase 5 [Halyomorpha halys]|uniref:beta-1,3-galactosyltransferase 5 n=1 Tax=Halyomorpha halys TaxID=286706 RepID=UPI0006D4FD63|nr:beta-1,3-galactosyltransferase 5 [Halyomorpha halys]
MHFRLRYIYVISLFVFIASPCYLFFIIITPKAPIHVLTKLIYEPGHNIENAKLCHGREPPKVFIGIISAPKNYEERNTIRATWGNHRRRDVVLAFFIGKSLDSAVNRKITQESFTYSDIVRSNNIDSYMNLTLKTISLIEWTLRHCSNARFVMKCDDDVFVNVTNLLSFINIKFDSKNTIFGELGKDLSPLWWPPRWYVSSSEYDKPRYPDFLFGPAYLLSSDCLRPLFTQALKTEFFRLEDVFITGIVAESVNIQRVGSPLFIRSDYTHEIDHGMNFNILNETKKRISIHGLSLSQQDEIWHCIAN